ncbi:hypothetical protein N9X04_00205 [bacterium]|nr:hypothetical protein [bacterium]
MARERVQVQGLGDAVPGIQPTIQRGGQYAVQVQRAGRNKLQDLAGALSQINPLLEQYAGVAEQEAQMFEEELSRKSPEEVQAMLKKTEGELDKQVRRGAMGWLTSPLNQKRKLRAVGQASSKLMMEQVYNRLENPEAGDEDLSTREVINLVQQNFVGENEGLSGSVFAQEGLQQAINPQILPLARQYDAQKSRVAKAATAGPVLDTVYHLVNNSYDGGSNTLFSDDFTEQVQEQWSNLGAFNAEEQKKFLTRTLQSLARDGNEVKADAFLEWASTNLKIGNAKLTVIEQSELSRFIDVAAKNAEDSEDERRSNLAKDLFNEYTQAHNAIQAGREGEYNGKTYSNVTQLQLDAENITTYSADLKMDNDALGLLSKNINTFVRGDVNPMERQQQELLRGTNGLDLISNTFVSRKMPGLIQANFEVLENDAEALNLQFNAGMEFTQSIQDKASELITSGLTVKEQKSTLLQFAKDEDMRIFSKFKKDIEDRSVEQQKEVQAIERVDSFLDDATNQSTKALEQSTWEKIKEKIPLVFDTQVDYTMSRENLKVLSNKAAPGEEKQKAFNNIKSYGVRDSALLSQKLAPNAWKKPPQYTGGRGFAVAIAGSGVRYTADEREKFLNQWMNINGFLDTFSNIELLSTGVSSDGNVRFDPTELSGRAKITRILTVDEIEAAKDITSNEDMPEAVKRKARLIGVEDVLQFVKDQLEFSKRLGLTN